MKQRAKSSEAAPQSSIGGDQPLTLHIDNTTLHRLRYLVQPQMPQTENLKLEVLNVLHLLEALVLADEITVSSFESEASQLVSNAAIETLKYLRKPDGSPLVRTGIHSSWESQLEIARETATEIFDRHLLTFNPLEDAKLSSGIDVAAARPSSVVEPTAPFWEMMCERGASPSEIRSAAAGEVHSHRTDGLFLFGIAEHEDFCAQVIRSYKRYGRPWPEEHWNRLHVLFRAAFTQRIADRVAGAIYSPPPVRAELLNRVQSLALRRFRETLEKLAIAASRGGSSFLSDYAGGFKVPIPLLGLAVLPMRGEKERLFERLDAVRREASDLRDQLRRLNALYMNGSKDEAFQQIERECQLITRGVSKQLGLQETRSLPSTTVDPAVLLSKKGLAGVPDLAKAKDWFASIADGRRKKRVRFLVNMLARAAEEPKVAQQYALLLGDGLQARLFQGKPPTKKASKKPRDNLWSLHNDIDVLEQDLQVNLPGLKLDEYRRCLGTFERNPHMAFTDARKILEPILRNSYRAEFGAPDRRTPPQKQALTLYQASKFVPNGVASFMLTIIARGNMSTHPADPGKLTTPVGANHFKAIFSASLAVADWYYRSKYAPTPSV